MCYCRIKQQQIKLQQLDLLKPSQRPVQQPQRKQLLNQQQLPILQLLQLQQMQVKKQPLQQHRQQAPASLGVVLAVLAVLAGLGPLLQEVREAGLALEGLSEPEADLVALLQQQKVTIAKGLICALYTDPQRLQRSTSACCAA